jgi:hypothetical protein
MSVSMVTSHLFAEEASNEGFVGTVLLTITCFVLTHVIRATPSVIVLVQIALQKLFQNLSERRSVCVCLWICSQVLEVVFPLPSVEY